MDTTPVPEPHFCRICFEGEKEDGDVNKLIELRCNCKGDMSRMHKKCILKWYGLRMILDDLFECELCITTLHQSTQLVVKQAVADHESQGRDILFKALASKLPPHRPHMDLESAATFQDLVELVDWIQHPYPIQVVFALPAPSLTVNADVPQAE